MSYLSFLIQSLSHLSSFSFLHFFLFCFSSYLLSFIHYLTGISKTESQVYTAYESRYKMPALKPAEFGKIYYSGFRNNSHECTPSVFLSEYNYGNSFYSFEAGLVHFIFLNPYTPSHSASKQYQFVRDDLLSVNRENTPWIVVLTHCPFYSSNIAHFTENQTVAMKVTNSCNNS